MSRRAALLALALLAAGLASRGARAQQPGPWLPSALTSFQGRDLKVESRLTPGLPAEVEKRLSSGLPTTAVWTVRLYVHRDLWWDGLKDERRYEVTAQFRPVAGDYTLERRLDGKLLETRVVPTREEAASALSRLPGIPCFTMGAHLVGKPLVVRVRCAYGSDVALGLLPTSTETDWVRSAIFEWTGGGER